MASVNLGRIGFVSKGTHSSGVNYKINDIVKYNGLIYCCTVAHTSTATLDTNKFIQWFDAQPSIPSSDILYDNSTSGLSATNVKTALDEVTAEKQEALVSGTNIKTVNSTSLLGSGDISVQPTLVSGTSIKTINSTSLLGSGDIAISTSKNYEFISEINASNAASVVFSSLSTNYVAFKIISMPYTLSGNGAIYVSFSTNNGTSFMNFEFSTAKITTSLTASFTSSQDYANIGEAYDASSNSSLELDLFTYASTYPSFKSKAFYKTGASTGGTYAVDGIGLTASRINYIKLTAQGQYARTFTGKFILFGIKE